MIIDLPPQTKQMLIKNAQNKGLSINEYLNILLKNDMPTTQTQERFPVGLMQNHPDRIILHDNFDEPIDDLFDVLK